MKINHFRVLLFCLLLLLISCKPKLNNKIDVKNYKEELKSIIKEDDNVDILLAFEEKKYISPIEFEELINFLSNEDSLREFKDFSYFQILFRIKTQEKIKLKKILEKEELQKKEELSKIAFKTFYVTIYFRETKQEIEDKVKKDDSLNGSFYKWPDEENYRIQFGYCKPYFAYSKGYGDNEERLDYFSIELDIHRASTYKDYYVGETKLAYDKIIKYLEEMYGETEHYYPKLNSYGIGYGDRFTVAEWNIGNTSISVDMYEKKELWDKYGYDSYETKYIVEASISNYDKNLIGTKNE